MFTFQSLASVLRLNTRLLLNCFDAITDADARRQPNEHTNNLIFLGCHLVDSRHLLAAQLDEPQFNPFSDRLDGISGIHDMVAFPSVEEVRVAWSTLAPHVHRRVENLRPEEIALAAALRFPVDDRSVGGMVAFLVQHESYHIGQMASIRKYLGYPSMKY